MITIDSLLPVVAQVVQPATTELPKKDKRIVLSLNSQVQSGSFLTKNQAKLFVKIINENKEYLKEHVDQLEEIVESNNWSKQFRVIKVVRKMYMHPEDEFVFCVEFSFNARIRDKLMKLNQKLEGGYKRDGAVHTFLLTESNLYNVVKTFKKDRFELDNKIKSLFKRIKDIKENTEDPFDIFTTDNDNLVNAVKAEVGSISQNNLLLLQDRKLMFQYTVEANENPQTLAEKIANRTTNKVHVDADLNFNDVVTALAQLKRFPALLVFNGKDSAKDGYILQEINEAMHHLGIQGDVGVYFRYNKDHDIADFNKMIAELEFNKNLGTNTVMAGLSNSKLPKFVVKDNWKPKTVVSFTNSFRANRLYAYCSDVDLIVYYTHNKPLSKEVCSVN